MKVLIVDDEANLRSNLSRYLEAEGFDVMQATCVVEARAAVKAPLDLIILDWMLPDGKGTDLLREWRNQGIELPIILLTAKSDLTDRVVGLELGADDYVVKPFEPRELLARIHVRLRRYGSKAEAIGPGSSGHKILLSGMELNQASRNVSFRGRGVLLTKTEYELLVLFVQNPERAFSREELLTVAYGGKTATTVRSVDNHLLQLRQKLDPRMFESIRGIGYRFMPLPPGSPMEQP